MIQATTTEARSGHQNRNLSFSYLVGLTLLTGISALPESSWADSRGVTLFDEEGFRGNRQHITRDQPLLSRRDPVGNDRTRSIRVDRGCEAVLFSQPNYRGRSMVVHHDEESLHRTPIGLDAVSSLTVRCERGRDRDRRRRPYDNGSLRYGQGALLFEHKGFQGRSLLVDRDVEHLGRTSLGNDHLTSIQIADGCRATLYRHSEFRGESLEIYEDIDNLKYTRFGNDEASSITIDCDHRRGDRRRGRDHRRDRYREPYDERGVTLYVDSEFRGHYETFFDDVPNMKRTRFGNDRASSIRVSPGCRVTLYSDSEYRGRSQTLGRDEENLRRTRVGNDTVSSMRIDCRRR